MKATKELFQWLSDLHMMLSSIDSQMRQILEKAVLFEQNLHRKKEISEKRRKAGLESVKAKKKRGDPQFVATKQNVLQQNPPIICGSLPANVKTMIGGIIEISDKPEPVDKKNQGSAVWGYYSAAYQKRYKINPLRNAKVNTFCKMLVNQVGFQTACTLVEYYLTRYDSFYTRACHPLDLCLRDAQKLITEKTNGNVVTLSDSIRMEKHDATDRAVHSYLRECENKEVK